MKKVIFIIGTLSNGGAERVVSNISMNLSQNIEKEIILFGSNSKIDYPYVGKITFLDKKVLNNPISKLKALFSRAKKLRKIKRRNPDVKIISFLEYPNLLNMLSGNRKNSIVSVRNYMSTKHKKGLKSLFWNFSIKHFYKKSSQVIAVSKEIKKDLINNYNLPKEKIKVIYNSYSLNNIKNLAEESLINKEEKIFQLPTIITVGRLDKQKGHIHLLKSFSKVKKSIYNVQLVFLGEGRLESELKKMTEELGIQDSVHFLGFKQNPFKYISKSKIFLLSSYFEGFPNVLAEAMACKVPVISTDCHSGPREILAPNEIDKVIDYKMNPQRYGVLVPDFHNNNKEMIEDLIAYSIKKILNSAELFNYYSDKSYDRVKDFSMENIISEWKKVCTSLEK